MKRAFHIGLCVKFALMERDLVADVIDAPDGVFVYAWTGYGPCVYMGIDELVESDASAEEIAAVIEDLFLETE